MYCGGSGAFGAGSPYHPDRYGGSSDPSLNGHIHYPNDIDRSLNEKIQIEFQFYSQSRAPLFFKKNSP
jgi:hypothetical protein